jgi:beta-glucosidase-like glycosyl hydrolase
LEAGCDIDSGNTYKDNLEATISSGLVDKNFSDAALFRSYRSRFQLGLFDPNVSNAYKQISTAEVGMASSQAVSEQASRKVGWGLGVGLTV